MIYQGDTYSFTLFLGRKDTSTVAISSVVFSGGVSTYTYTPVSGPPLELGTMIVVSSMASGNNGPFTITGLGVNFDSLGFPVSYTFTCNSASGSSQVQAGQGIVGTIPNVTVPPVIQIVQLSTQTGMLGTPAAMTALDDTDQCWFYTWSVGAALQGQYVAIASYTVDGSVFNSQPFEKLTVGDTRVTGPVALDSTVAHDATVAKDATVAHQSDVEAIAPQNSSIILDIQAHVDNLPADPAGMTLLNSYLLDIVDIHDFALGNQTIDKTQSPPVFTMNRVGGGLLETFQITDTANSTQRIAT